MEIMIVMLIMMMDLRADLIFASGYDDGDGDNNEDGGQCGQQ